MKSGVAMGKFIFALFFANLSWSFLQAKFSKTTPYKASTIPVTRTTS